MKHKILSKDNKVVIFLNPKLYSLEAIYGACYVFIDRAYIFLDGDPKKEIELSIKSKSKMPAKKLEALVGEFQNELLNYALREKLSKANRKIREYIIGKALYYDLADTLKDSEDVSDESQEDPLGIAIPWEEKYDKDKVS